jgi:SsrA-binding protein
MSLITNKKAQFNYDIGEKYTAGIELFGFEVKSIRKGQGSLDGSYVTVRGGEAFLINAFIPPFQEKNAPKDYDPNQTPKPLEPPLKLATGLTRIDVGKKKLFLSSFLSFFGKALARIASFKLK